MVICTSFCTIHRELVQLIKPLMTNFNVTESDYYVRNVFFPPPLLAIVGTSHAPLITQHPQNFNVKLGDSLNISCESEWTFDQWLLNGSSISDGDDYAITSTSTGSRLLIKSFEGDEAGEYRCRFSNGSNSVLSQPGRVKYFCELYSQVEN